MPIDYRAHGSDILVLVYAGKFSDAEYEHALAHMRRELESARAARRKIAMISIGGADSGMTSRQRVRSAEWVREHTTDLRAACVAQAVVVTGAIQRGVLTAILWMTEYPVPIRACSSEDEALQWVRTLLVDDSRTSAGSSL